jgi:RND family efflux transporter MFP subunit
MSTAAPCGLALALLTPALLPGCAPGASVATAGEPVEDEHPSVVTTVWDQGYELFVEHPVPVAGEAVTLVTHVTDVRTGAPRTEGPAVFFLRSAAEETVRVDDPAPARAGIYLPEVVFPTPGEWQVVVELPGRATLSLPPVVVHASEEAAHAAELPPEPEGVSFLKEQQWRLGTRIAPLARTEVSPHVIVPGVVREDPARSAVITAPVAGRLEAPTGGALPRLGEELEAGDLIAYVRPPFGDHLARIQEAEAEALRATLAAERAQVVLERVEQLFAVQARSERELEEARFDAELAAADRDAAHAVRDALRAGGVVPSDDGVVRFELRAPIAGIVREVSAVNGSWAGAGDALFELRDSSRVFIEAWVRPQVLAAVVALERPLFLRSRGAHADTGVLPVADARLVSVGDRIDEHNLTVPVTFDAPNPGARLFIGELVEVQLATGEPIAELVLSSSALVEEEGRHVVYVQLGGETFERREVELGFRDGELLQVLSGIAEGEQVVVEGAYAVRLASAAGGAPAHGHGH